MPQIIRQYKNGSINQLPQAINAVLVAHPTWSVVLMVPTVVSSDGIIRDHGVMVVYEYVAE